MRLLAFQKMGTLVVALAALVFGFASGCQPKANTFTVGVVNFTTKLSAVYDGFKTGMAELGYVEGQNITYVYSGGLGTVEALDPEIRNIIARKVDMVFAITTPATMKVQAATAGTTLPVVFAPVNDPVASGIVKTLSRPGGNLTGIRTGGFAAKELEWLVSLAPDSRRVFVVHNPDDGSSVAGLAASKEAASKLGIQLVVHEARTAEQLNPVFTSFPEDADAILVLPNNMALDRIADFVKVAQARQLPLASVSYAQLEAGALLTYGPDFFQVGRQAARLADKVLKGTAPADLPVETSEFFLSVNLRTAQDIGLTIPDQVLLQADRVIR